MEQICILTKSTLLIPIKAKTTHTENLSQAFPLRSLEPWDPYRPGSALLEPDERPIYRSESSLQDKSSTHFCEITCFRPLLQRRSASGTVFYNWARSRGTVCTKFSMSGFRARGSVRWPICVFVSAPWDRKPARSCGRVRCPWSSYSCKSRSVLAREFLILKYRLNTCPGLIAPSSRRRGRMRILHQAELSFAVSWLASSWSDLRLDRQWQKLKRNAAGDHTQNIFSRLFSSRRIMTSRCFHFVRKPDATRPQRMGTRLPDPVLQTSPRHVILTLSLPNPKSTFSQSRETVSVR